MKFSITVLVVFLTVLGNVSSAFSQAVLLKTMTLEVCNCLAIAEDVDNVTSTDSLMQLCFKASIGTHISEIKDSLNIDLKTPEGHSELGALFMYTLLQDCDRFVSLMAKITGENAVEIPDLLPLTTGECALLHNMSFNVVDDSTLVPENAMVFVNNHLTEYTIDGTMTADYTITWTSPCSFDARVIFSTDKTLEELKTSNRAIGFEFIGKRNNHYFLMMTFFGVKHVFMLEQD